MIITFASSKGGVGKSTACICFAGALAARKEQVLILDLDENNTATRWTRTSQKTEMVSEFISVKAIEPAKFPGYIKELASSPDRPNHILIDVAGAFETAMLMALNRSHLAIIPAQPSEPDVYEAQRVIQLIDNLNDMRPQPLPYRLLLTLFDPLNTPPQPNVVDQVRKKGLPRLESVMTRRTPYKEIFLTGSTPHADTSGRASIAKACSELDGIIAELNEVVSLKEVA